MNSDCMDWWDDYPRRSIDREGTIRAIATWINAEGTVMPRTVLHYYYGGFRIGVIDPSDDEMLHVPSERAYPSSALALTELGLLLDTAIRRMEGSEAWPEGPALDEIIQHQREREASKLDTLATLFASEPHLVTEIKDGMKPGSMHLDAATLPECLWDAFEVEGDAFKRELEEEIHYRVMKK